MRVLLDNNVNQRFAFLLPGHEIIHARQMGWGELLNGDLIATAEEQGFEVMVTADKNLQYQQNLTRRKISIIVLNSLLIKWEHIAPLAPQVQTLLNAMQKKELPSGFFITIEPEVSILDRTGKK